MAQIQQVSNTIGNKGYNSTLDSNTNPNGEAFQINGLNKTEQVQSVQGNTENSVNSESAGNAGSANTPATNIKEPSLAVENVKDIINDELIASAKLNGYTELVGEIEALTKQLYLKPEQLVDEIVSQEKQNTIFSGNEFFTFLRELAADGNDSTREIIGTLLKGLNFAQTKNDILNAISSNLRFLSDYFSANQKLSDNLLLLANKWSADDAQSNFTSLKSQTATLVMQLSESILNDDKTQSLVPLITHNMSRFNTNYYMIKEAFSQLLTHIPTAEARNSLVESFDGLLRSIFGEKELQNFVYSNNDNSELSFAEGKTGLTQSNGTDKQPAQNVAAENQQSGTSQATTVNSNIAGQTAQGLTDNTNIAAQASKNETGDTNLQAPANSENSEENLNNLPHTYNNTTNDGKNQVENALFVKNLQKISVSEYIQQIYEDMGDEEISRNLDSQSNLFESAVKSFLLGKTDGMTSIRAIIAGFLPESPDVDAAIANETAQIKSLSGLVDYLNEILKYLPEFDKSQSVFDAFEEIVTGMARKNELPDHDPLPEQQNAQQRLDENVQKNNSNVTNTMKSLTQYIEHNINHPALKTIDNFNAANLLQSILNAPGVMTPLSHFIIPLQVGVTKAFGELWVDNDSENHSAAGEGGAKNHHLFLTFDVDAIGRFEVDIYAHDKDISMSILHPRSYTEKAHELAEKIGSIASASGYHSENVHTGVLKTAHTLTEVFPKLYERRNSFNVTA